MIRLTEKKSQDIGLHPDSGLYHVIAHIPVGECNHLSVKVSLLYKDWIMDNITLKPYL